MNISPAPWSVYINNAYHTSWIIRCYKGNQIAQVANYQDKSFDINAEANAHLISAAPDLLDALENLLEEQNGIPILRREKEYNDAIQKAMEAIVKAKGGGE